MDPLGLAASIAQLLGYGTRGVEALGRKTPYGAFWDDLERQLAPEHDIPWDDIVARCHLQPSFIENALAYIGGDDTGRVALEAHFNSFVELPDGAREDRRKILDRIYDAVATAANAAAADDRSAAFASRQLILDAIATAITELSSGIEQVRIDIAASRRDQSEELAAVREELAAVRRQVDRTGPAGASTLPNSEWVDQFAERAAERFLSQLSRQEPEPEVDSQPERQALLPTEPGVEPTSPQEHLDRLRQADQAGAAFIERLVRADGVLGIATALRTGGFAGRSIPTLVAAARIVAISGFHLEAEQAYLRAADLADGDRETARNLVRAARVARVAGSEQRYERHLSKARDLVPELPALVIAQARDSTDPILKLQRLDGVKPDNANERAMLHVARAEAHLALGDDAKAQAQLDLAREAQPDNAVVLEFEATLPWLHAQRAIAEGESPNLDELLSAGERLASLSLGLISENRADESAQIGARAAEAFMLAGDLQRSTAVLQRLPPASVLRTDTSLAVAQVALIAQQFDLVLAYAPSGSDQAYARVLRAEALVLSSEGEVKARGLAELTALLSDSDELVSGQAAFALLVAASQSRTVDWSETAAEIVTRKRPDLAARLRAEREALIGNYAEAERLLRPHARSLSAQRRLRDYAALAEHWEKAADRSRELIKQANEGADRLAYADALVHLARTDEALKQFVDLGNDASAEYVLRDRAFGGAMEIVGSDRDYPAIRDMALQWLKALPDSENALWNLMFAHTRLGRAEDALELARAHEAAPRNEQRATLLAEIYYRAAPRHEALRRLIELSDQFDRKVEALEGMLIAAGIDAAPEDLERDPEIAARVRDAFATFPTRFPDQQTIRALPAPQSAEEFQALMRELAGDRPAIQAEMADAVRDGTAPVNAFAAAGPNGVATTWTELHIWPLGFAMRERDAADYEAARTALGGAAVWDSSALVVACHLRELTGVIAAALPGSFVVNETLQDADAEILLHARRVAQTVHQPDGQVFIREISDAERERAEAQAREVMQLARSKEVRPARGDGVSEELIGAYDELDDRAHEQRALVGTLALAQRTGRAVYSDDRWVREAARLLGLSAFGTLAMLTVLTEEGLATSDQYRRARLALAERGVWGLAITAEELVAAGEASHFASSDLLVNSLYDRAAWRAQPATRMMVMGAFLNQVYDRRPDEFRNWTREVLRSGISAAPQLTPGWFSEALLVMVWEPGETEPTLTDACFQQLVDEIKHLPPDLSTLGHDPVVAALNRFMELVADEPEERRFRVFRLAFRRLRLLDQIRMLEIFVRFDDEGQRA